MDQKIDVKIIVTIKNTEKQYQGVQRQKHGWKCIHA